MELIIMIMKMKTKRLSYALAFLMTLSLCSCGASESNKAAVDTAPAAEFAPVADAAGGSYEGRDSYKTGEIIAKRQNLPLKLMVPNITLPNQYNTIKNVRNILKVAE